MAFLLGHTGLVLTNAPSLAVVGDALSRGGYNVLKVVSGWGLPGGWTRETIQQAVRIAPTVIVRTRTGDPSLDKRFGGDFAFVDQHRVEAELYPWYRERPDLWIELGNEPNAYPLTVRQMHEYAYFLSRSVERCRVIFPEALLMAPAMIIDRPNAEQFMAICRPIFNQCDAIALHAYEWETFAGPVAGRKGELEQAFAIAGRLFPQKRWFLSEYGIHGPQLTPAVKGARYAQLLHRRPLPEQLLGASYYHLCIDGKIQPEYHIYPKGDLGYHRARFEQA